MHAICTYFVCISYGKKTFFQPQIVHSRQIDKILLMSTPVGPLDLPGKMGFAGKGGLPANSKISTQELHRIVVGVWAVIIAITTQWERETYCEHGWKACGQVCDCKMRLPRPPGVSTDACRHMHCDREHKSMLAIHVSAGACCQPSTQWHNALACILPRHVACCGQKLGHELSSPYSQQVALTH